MKRSFKQYIGEINMKDEQKIEQMIQAEGLNAPRLTPASIESVNEWTGILDSACPTVEGWYATLHAWDVREGLFIGHHYWDGKSWNISIPIYMWAGPFSSEEQANNWASEHDPEA